MKKLTIVGLGIREFDHLTLEGLEVIRHAEKTLFLATLDDHVSRRLTELGIDSFENMRPLYLNGAIDLDNYKALFKRIVSACRTHNSVCVLLPGHPRVGVTIVQWLEQAKDELGIELRVLEGISSFCTLINQLAIDPLEYGAEILDANRIIQMNQSLNPQIDTFIYHVCSVGVSATHLSNPSKDNRLDLLQAQLENQYPLDQPVYLVSAGRGEFEPTTCRAGTVGHLSRLLPEIHFGTTLYLPAKSREE